MPCSPKARMMLEHMDAEEKAAYRDLYEKVSTDMLHRVAYIPFVVAELAWDYADTAVSIASQLRLRETRKASRDIRTARREYNVERYYYIAEEQRRLENDNALAFEESAYGTIDSFNRYIALELRRLAPGLDTERRGMVEAACQCRFVTDALIAYSAKWRGRLSGILGRKVGEILPKQIFVLRDSLRTFMEQVDGLGESIDKDLRTFADILVARLSEVEFQEHKTL